MSRGVAVVVALVSVSSLACVTTHHVGHPITPDDLPGVPNARPEPVANEYEPVVPAGTELRAVKAVEVRNHARGAMEGLGWGLLSGAVLGAAAGYASGAHGQPGDLFYSSAGGTAALGAVMNLTEDKDESVQDEAVRTLSSWPNTWPVGVRQWRST